MRWILLLFFLFSFESFAFGVSPMTGEIDVSGRLSQQKFVVTNKFKTPLDVEVTPHLLEWKEGKYSAEETDDLMILPDTAVIEPGETRAILIKYFGDPDIQSSKAYIIRFKQVSTNNVQDVGGTSVNMAVNFEAVLTLVPNKVSSGLQISSAIKNNDGKWLVTVDNVGNKHEWASEYNWVVENGKDSVVFTGKDISNKLSHKFFPPRSSIQAIVDLDDELANSESLNIHISDVN